MQLQMGIPAGASLEMVAMLGTFTANSLCRPGSDPQQYCIS